MSIFWEIMYVHRGKHQDPAVSARPTPAYGGAYLVLNDKLLQGHGHFLHTSVLSHFTHSSKYYQTPPLLQVSGAGTIETHRSATAQPSLVLQRRQLQGGGVSALHEIHKDVISYKMRGTLHGQEILPLPEP